MCIDDSKAINRVADLLGDLRAQADVVRARKDKRRYFDLRTASLSTQNVEYRPFFKDVAQVRPSDPSRKSNV